MSARWVRTPTQSASSRTRPPMPGRRTTRKARLPRAPLSSRWCDVAAGSCAATMSAALPDGPSTELAAYVTVYRQLALFRVVKRSCPAGAERRCQAVGTTTRAFEVATRSLNGPVTARPDAAGSVRVLDEKSDAPAPLAAASVTAATASDDVIRVAPIALTMR